MKYFLEKQKKWDWCYPACLQAILKRHKIGISQDEIARDLRINGNGARVYSVQNFLKKKGFKLYFFNYNETPFNEIDFFLEYSLEDGLDVLVAIPNPEKNHIFLLEEFNFPYLFLKDPDNLETEKIEIQKLTERMRHGSSVGGFGLVKKL